MNPNKSLLISVVLAISIVALLASCGARKTQSTKDIEKAKELDKISSIGLDWSKLYEKTKYFDKGIIYTKETGTDGSVKETFNHKNESKESIKTKEVINKKTLITYKSITTYKSVTNKNTQSDGISIWVWFIGIFFVFLFAVLKWNKELFRFRN